ncbi:MAG: hypothetical protein ABL952_07980, partial [Pyrinomonadaceae bacterium]
MPVTRQQSTSFVNVRGLGIVCFNPTLGRSETAIIRPGGQQLSIDISRPGFIDGAGADTTGFISLFHRAITELEDVAIEISALGQSTYNGYDIFQTGGFDRVDDGDNDPNDIRWIINLESSEMHGPGLVKNESGGEAPKPPITRLFISDALFYAVMPDDGDIDKTPYFMKTDPRNDSTSEFGHLAETMGANIQAGGVQVKLTIGGTEEIMTYDHVAGSPLRIEITNVDPNPDAMATDCRCV